ncbi:class I SAM-dependent methyltransferase [Dethiobacter alkaliphilus]|uniref:class I SAM-dependent methyltransferase n=1 Tax=Dethiobacter alkaliphilus TaxID=427926 RepID=UPI002228070E|nr:class I SAM-dependent methyltransferase [Dethiobacter alkaliphilus]MCW3490634.1 class I SAM-dependent methyltransferase [Dethiobacter alkaliphilus]
MFYETLARYYDDIFPSEPAKLTFLHREFQVVRANSVLDLACGTGTYSIELALLGYKAWGTDLEPGMIEQARTKAQQFGVDASFAVGDMRKPQSLGQKFDGLFCIGNSLAHLPGRKELQEALQAMYGVLETPGVAVFQIVNFDRILARGDTDLPLIEREHLRFTRTYRPQSENKLIFDSVLELKMDDGSVKRLDNSVELRPIRQQDLKNDMEAAGFTDVKTFGNFKRDKYISHDSPATVMVARH